MSPVRLSPLSLSGIKRCHGDLDLTELGQSQQVESVTAWRCMRCADLHEDEDDAIDCCMTPMQQYRHTCPVCSGGPFSTVRDVTDCCLWKDLPAAERWVIADAVAAGKTWLEALGLQQGAPS